MDPLTILLHWLAIIIKIIPNAMHNKTPWYQTVLFFFAVHFQLLRISEGRAFVILTVLTDFKVSRFSLQLEWGLSKVQFLYSKKHKLL